MKVDLAGTALVITAVCAGTAAVIGPIVNAWLQIKASRKADANKQESIAARNATTATLLAGQSAIHEDVKKVVDATTTGGPT